MAGNKIVHLHFTDGQDFYFGSFAAMYEHFTADEIGFTYNEIINGKLVRPGIPLVNDHITIKMGELVRKRGNRGIGKKQKN